VLEEQLACVEQHVADAERVGHERLAEIIATLAGVDRIYLYDHPDLLEEIRRLRTITPAGVAARRCAASANRLLAG
jgi:hypothetical protein